MRKLVLSTFAVLVLMSSIFASPAEAQSIKTVPWVQFAPRVEFAEMSGGSWDFTHEGRRLEEYTLVEVPAGELSVGTFFHVSSTEGLTLYLAALNSASTVRVSNRDASVRVMFTCRLATDGECRDLLSEHLRLGVEMQSLSVGNTGYETGAMPERVILSFLVNTEGRFKY